MANTFTLRPGTVVQNQVSPGGWFPTNNLGVDLGTLVNNIRVNLDGLVDSVEEVHPLNPLDTSVGGTALLFVTMDQTTIILTGDVSGTFDFFNLPAGFTVVTANIRTQLNSQGGSYDVMHEGFSLATTSSGGVVTTAIPSPTTLGVLLGSYGVDVDTIAGWQPPLTAQWDFLQVTGTYVLVSFSWTTETTRSTTAPFLISPGEQFTLESDPLDPDPLQIEHLSAINIQYTDRDGDTQTFELLTTTFVIALTNNIFVSFFPDFDDIDASQPAFVIGIGDGTQFTGSVTLLTLTILIENGSGIYRIVSGKTNDTLYTNSAVDDTTADVMIPQPFAKTGFVGG